MVFKTISDDQATIKELEKQIQDLEEKSDQTEDPFTKKPIKKAALTKRIIDDQEKIHKLDNDNKALHKSIDSLEKQVKTLETQLKELQVIDPDTGKPITKGKFCLFAEFMSCIFSSCDTGPWKLRKYPYDKNLDNIVDFH